jgi:hypothetical protein
MLKEAKVISLEEEIMPERDGELPSRIIQSKLQNKYSKSRHVLCFSTLNKFRASPGVKITVEAVPAELIRLIFQVSGVVGEAVVGLRHITHNFGGSYDD